MNEQWWTPYDMPLTAFDAVTFDGFDTSIKMSLGAISGRGLVILGICLSLLMIGGVFRELLLDKLRFIRAVKNREFGRKVSAEDRIRNMDSIVEDRAASMEVNMMAKQRFRMRNPNADLEEKIYQREVSYQADIAFHEKHPDAYGWRREYYRNKANDYYDRMNEMDRQEAARKAGKIVVR